MSILLSIKKKLLLLRYGSVPLYKELFTHPDPSTPIKNCNFTVFDTEATSINPRKAHLVSIGAIKVVNLELRLSECLHRLVRVNELSRESVQVHGITEEELRELGRPPSAVVKEFLYFAKGSILVGYNVDYDVRVVEKIIKSELGFPLPFPRIELITLLARRGIKPADLGEVARALDLPAAGLHSAINDAYTTALIFLKLVHPIRDMPLSHLPIMF